MTIFSCIDDVKCSPTLNTVITESSGWSHFDAHIFLNFLILFQLSYKQLENFRQTPDLYDTKKGIGCIYDQSKRCGFKKLLGTVPPNPIILVLAENESSGHCPSLSS